MLLRMEVEEGASDIKGEGQLRIMIRLQAVQEKVKLHLRRLLPLAPEEATSFSQGRKGGGQGDSREEVIPETGTIADQASNRGGQGEKT